MHVKCRRTQRREKKKTFLVYFKYHSLWGFAYNILIMSKCILNNKKKQNKKQESKNLRKKGVQNENTIQFQSRHDDA